MILNPKAPICGLAAAALSEEILIQRIANTLLKNGVFPPKEDESGHRATVRKRRVKNAVKAISVRRGRIRKTEEAIVAEMARQAPIRKERTARQDRSGDRLDGEFTAYIRKDKYRRMTLLLQGLTGDQRAGDCTDFAKVDGHLCLLYGSFMSGGSLLVKHPGGETHIFKLGSGRRKIHEALMEMAGYLLSREAYLFGATVGFDLCRGVFKVCHPDGRVEEKPFDKDPVEVCDG